MYRVLPTAVAALLAISPAAAAQWAAINLNPPDMQNSIVWAVTPTMQFGEAFRMTAPFSQQPMGWSGSASTAFTLGTVPQEGGAVYAASAATQAGIFMGQASLWQGTSSSRISLGPAGYWYSAARAVTATHQFGFTRLTINHQARAAMWSGTAASFVDMNPPGADSSAIRAAFGDRQGGAATYVSNEYLAHAGLWSGTPESFVEIHPGTAYGESVVIGMHGDQQVGSASPRYGQVVGWPHAALWHGTAESFVDLDPGAGYSALNATVGSAQVGYIAPPGGIYAGIWYGTAASFHDLSQYLPAGYHSSRATSIATDGVNYYVGGYASRPGSFVTDAFLWVGPVPAPGTFPALLFAGIMAGRQRRREEHR